MSNSEDLVRTSSPLAIEDNLAKCPEPSKLVFGCHAEDADISICVPVFGLGRYLLDALLSIINAEKSSLKKQIIISDNKPYENEQNPFPGFLSNLPKDESISVAYYHINKNIGVLNNFNRAFSLARTTYAAMLHDDDLLCDDYFVRLERLLPWLQKHPNVGMVHCRYAPFSVKPSPLPKAKNALVRITKASVTSLGATGTGVPSCGTLVHRDLFFATGGFNETFKASGDAFPAAIMLYQGTKVSEFAYYTGHYRIALNGSLKLDICQRFIREDYLFYQAWKKRGGPLRRLYMSFLERLYYSVNIEGKVGLFHNLNPEITTTSLDILSLYKKYGKASPKLMLFIFYKKASRFLRWRLATRF